MTITIEDEIPRKQSYLLSSLNALATSTTQIYMTLDLSSVRTSNKYLCSQTNYTVFKVEACYAMILVLFDSTIGTTTSSIELFRREFYSYSYDLLPSGLTVKTVFIQEYSDLCETCNLVVNPQIMVKFCTNLQCSSPLTNNTVRSGQSLFANIGLLDQILLFNYTIQSLQLFDNGLDITKSTNKTALTESTGSAVQMGFSVTGAGTHKLELRVILNAKPVVLDASGKIVYDNKDFYTANFTLVIPTGTTATTDTSIIWLYVIIISSVMTGSCLFGFLMYWICSCLKKKKKKMVVSLTATTMKKRSSKNSLIIT